MVNHTSSCIRQCNVRKNILVGRFRLYHKIYRIEGGPPPAKQKVKGFESWQLLNVILNRTFSKASMWGMPLNCSWNTQASFKIRFLISISKAKRSRGSCRNNPKRLRAVVLIVITRFLKTFIVSTCWLLPSHPHKTILPGSRNISKVESRAEPKICSCK